MVDPDSRASRRATSLPIWIFLGSLAVRLFVLIRFSSSAHFLPMDGDMKFYNEWALRILKGQFTDHQAFYGLPGYPFFLAGIYSITGFSPFLVGLLQTVAEAGTAVLIFKIATEIFQTRTDVRNESSVPASRSVIVGTLAAFLWTFYQPAQTFSVILMPTSWLVLVFWGCVWRLLKVRRTSILHPWPALGVLIGLTAVMVATILFLIPLVVLSIIVNSDPAETKAARSWQIFAANCLFFCGVLVGTSPCWVHNYFVAGEPVFLSAHSGVNFYIGNNALANGYPKIPPGLRAGQEGMLKDSITMAEVAAGHPLKRADVSRYWSAKAQVYIHENFHSWLGLMGLKILNFWNAYQYDDLSLITLFRQDEIITPGLRFGFLSALAIPGLVVAVFKYRRARWVVAAVFLHMAALLPVFVTERYRLAAVPGLILFAVIGLWEFWASLLSGRKPFSFAYTIGTIASVLFVSKRPADAGLWSLDYYNTGIKALEAGDLSRARENLETAFEYVPDNSEINFAIGNFWLQKGDRFKSKLFYKRTIEMNARHAGAYNNLGVLAMEEKHWKLAGVFFTHSVEIDPEDAKTHYLLAKVMLEIADVSSADAEIKRALKLKPGQQEFQSLQTEIGLRLQQRR